MANIINASTINNGLVYSADASGDLELQVNGQAAVTIAANKAMTIHSNVSFAGGQLLPSNYFPVAYIAVAGGGGGGANEANPGGDAAGGGGAGGYLEGTLLVTRGLTWAVTVGSGGSGTSTPFIAASNGGNTSITGTYLATSGNRFDSILAYGGGGGGGDVSGRNGGSGGGAGNEYGGSNVGGRGVYAGSTYLYHPIRQGYDGGDANSNTTGARGGSGGGGSAGPGGTRGGGGGAGGGPGITSGLTGTFITYASGGPGGSQFGSSNGGSGSANTGNGGGGASSPGPGGSTQYTGGNGGSGVVIFVSKANAAATSGAPVQNINNGFISYTFTSSGTITW